LGLPVFFYNFSTWLGRPGLYLEDLFVKPEKRGKGYGRALLVNLAKIAHDRGCGRMEWAVLDWNDPAIKFYRALGAKPMDEWTVFRLTRDGIAELREVRIHREGTMTMGGTKIEDYAFLSDTQTGALVSRDGCVDWLCFPRFDSPACFASLPRRRRKMAVGFSIRRGGREKRVVGIETTRSSWRQKLKRKAAPCA
jgi:hypothetical protein